MNAQQILSGLGWSAGATVVSAVCQFAFMAVLARLLDPVSFGLMAMANIALRFASFFAQVGFSQALIQKPKVEAEDTTAALVMALVISSALYACMVLAAPLFAAAFKAPELTALIGVLGLSLVLGVMSSLPLALLRRQARFKRVNAIEVTSFVLGYGAVGIACAMRGMGVWSLVAATLSQQALCILLGFLSVKYPVKWPLRRHAFVHLWVTGSKYSLVGFVEFLYANTEAMFVGRVLGKLELGFFNRATMLTNLPAEMGVSALTKVLFPALSSMQTDRGRMGDGFQIMLLAVGLFSTALACGIAAAASDVVNLLLGTKWVQITPIVSVVAFAVPPMFMYVACGVTLDSLAALKAKLRLQAGMVALKILLVLALAHWGLTGIAAAVVLAEVIRLVWGLRLVSRLLGIAASQIWWQAGLFVLFGLVIYAAVGGAARLGLSFGLPLPGRVALETAVGLITMAGCLAWLLSCFKTYAPLQRFDSVSRWHRQVLQALQFKVSIQ
jgi:lipopolysaccharide exporter